MILGSAGVQIFRERPLSSCGGSQLGQDHPGRLNKLDQYRRRHIPWQKHRVTNSAAYDVALRQRGSLTVWFTDKAIEAWQARGAPPQAGSPATRPSPS